MAKLDRLLNLTAALLDTRVPLTAEELRLRVPGYSSDSDEAFHRAFERDKDDLRELGIPIETVTVEHHEQPRAAYTIHPEAYALPDPGFELDELAAIQLAAAAVQLEGLDDEPDEALRKLGGTPISGNASETLGEVPTPAVLLDLFVAVLEHRTITFRYLQDERRMHPYRLQFERGRWYVTGYDLDRGAKRSFRLDRIADGVSSGDPGSFEPPDDPAGVRLRPWELGDGEPQEALLLLDAAVSRAVLNEDPGLGVHERREDGSVVLALTVRDPGALRGFVFNLLDRAELLAPAWMRQELIDDLSAMAEEETT